MSTDPVPMRERCPRCDREMATAEDLRHRDERTLCWFNWGGDPLCVDIGWRARCLAAEAARDAAVLQLNTPETLDFVRAVTTEAGHQRARWGSEHDGGKTDADWFWLIGYLGGKALHNPGGDPDKQLHRIVTVAAAAANWHASKLGVTDMRPGIEPPAAIERGDTKEG